MRNDALSKNTDDMYERERIRYQSFLSSVQRFKFFFAGLVFAVLSFSLQFQTKSNDSAIVAYEIGSWILLAVTGFFALKDCGGFSSNYSEAAMDGLSSATRRVMFSCFLGAIALLMLSKGLESYSGKVAEERNKTTQSTAKASAD